MKGNPITLTEPRTINPSILDIDGQRDPFAMDVREFRAGHDQLVNMVDPLTTAVITAVTFSVTKYVVITVAGFC